MWLMQEQANRIADVGLVVVVVQRYRCFFVAGSAPMKRARSSRTGSPDERTWDVAVHRPMIGLHFNQGPGE